MSRDRPRRVAVTGGSGRVGCYVLDELAPDHRLTVVDRVAPDAAYAFAMADMLDQASLSEALRGHDAIVHLAGVDLDRDAEAPDYFNGNAIGTWNVLEVARQLGIGRVVVCSSVTASGLPEGRPDWLPEYFPVDEAHRDAPHHPYGISKLLAETLADAYAGDGSMAVLSLRAMWVSFPENVGFALERARNPGARWTFAHVAPEDLAHAVRCALHADEVRRGSFYISAADSCHPEPTLDWLQRAWAERLPPADVSRFADFPRASLFDGGLARARLGFVPRRSWADQLRAAGLTIDLPGR